MENMIDDFFICGFYSWIIGTNGHRLKNKKYISLSYGHFLSANLIYITFAISYRLSLGMQLMSLKSFQFNYLIIYKLSLQFLVNLFPLLLDFALCHRVYYHNIIFACPSRNKDVFVRTITSTMLFLGNCSPYMKIHFGNEVY